MTDNRMVLIEALQKADDSNFLKTFAETVLQLIMQVDVEDLIRAGAAQPAPDPIGGYRERPLETRLGTLNLKISKLRTG